MFANNKYPIAQCETLIRIVGDRRIKRGITRWVIAASSSVAIGHAALDAVIANYPDQRFALRNGIPVIREHAPRAAKPLDRQAASSTKRCADRSEHSEAAGIFETACVIDLCNGLMLLIWAGILFYPARWAWRRLRAH